MGLESGLSASVNATLTTAQDLGQQVASMGRSYGARFTDGAAAGQANAVFHDQRTIPASGTESLDLAGALVGPSGAAVTFARVKGLLIAAAPSSSSTPGAPVNANDIIIGNDAASWASWLGAATHTIRLRPGAFIALGVGPLDATGYVVTPTTADILKITNGGAGSSVTYDIVIIGAAT